MKKSLIYTPRVQVSQYSAMADSLLLTEVRNIVAAVTARIADYKDVQTNFEALSTQFDKFDAALAAAATKASDAVAVKNNERKILLSKINEFGLALAANCKGDTTYITNTTMKLAIVPTANRLPKELLIPVIINVEIHGAGTILVEMERLKAPTVMVMMMYKTNDMADWKLGRLFNKANMVIGDLPRQKDVSFRFCAVDGFGNMSGFTETFTISMS